MKNTETKLTDADKALKDYRNHQLKPLQRKMLDMLSEIAEILDRNGIQYWLVGGSLLGAMRHGGFIPWDDDIDISILMDDEAKMKSVLERELSEHLVLSPISSRRPIYKVRDVNSFFVEPMDDFSSPYPKGVFVDIFLMERAPAVSRSFARKVAKNYCRSNAILHKQHYYSLRSFVEFFYFGAMRAICKLLWSSAKAVCSMDKYITYQASGNGSGLLHEKDKIFPLRKVAFEDKEFYVPNDADYYLTEAFGNWREVPPLEKRETHAIYYDIDLTNKDL